ncbi:MAG: preprotein translocase subunit SecY [Acidimicrobiaceae bacterium]|uniref:preprotein translocase subunit SecY n=1 Tax=Candidatus Poriferisodalis multihospitum TaxID=2983191 RepID=UPI0022940E79|nr:preprotein translocase subunit SecY [Candidatus Poriferisodalis multihospitum]MCY3586957.1 preprotein translocase subunit SecY [Acidimicrobiaceae bacterium]MCY3949108.1 preprotein translocase subunit SecY [Acidimicrobiaceae bacterium]MDE0136446.1 preprotein translocase subunit SecY [Acidimicrobiaceae bacterium]MDE0320019.1 preprotein translocase subunit SecY [Acidimicrobiaceae bacterium]MDE0499097.1 preprotein translocase subunit SecY [Acidimicrobiaceae bacterium]
MLGHMRNIFRIADLRRKIMFTLFIIAAYRLGSQVPVPGIDFDAIVSLREQASSTGGVLALLNLFSGGALTNFAIFALGIMPYITASIIIQILTVAIPRFEQLQQQGAVGQRKLTQYTRYLTLGIAFVQATGITFIFGRGQGTALGNTAGVIVIPDFTFNRVALVILSLTAGTALLMWMGELISQRGVGNGMSLLIFASVVSTIPFDGARLLAVQGTVYLAAAIIVATGMMVAIIFIEQGQRRIPVQFSRRQVGRRLYGGQNTYIPLKVNQSGVIPVIFASSILFLPVLLSNVANWGWLQTAVDEYLTQPDNIAYILFFGGLIVGFAYFYTAITFDPVRQADNIRKQGGFIPGIRPGPQTERYLAKVLNRITLPGALFIAMVALLPSVLLSLTSDLDALGSGGAGAAIGFGGVSILIASGVALETMKQVDSQLLMRNYEGFLA